MVTVMLRARPIKFSDYKFGKSYWDLVMASMPSIITFLYTFNKDLTVKKSPNIDFILHTLVPLPKTSGFKLAFPLSP